MADFPLFFYDNVTILKPQSFKSLKLPFNPSHNQRHNKNDLLFILRPALLDSMPLLNASSATGGSCVLGNENRMTYHWRLFAVVFRKIGSNPGIYKLICVIFDGFETFGGNVVSVFFR